MIRKDQDESAHPAEHDSRENDERKCGKVLAFPSRPTRDPPPGQPDPPEPPSAA